MTRNLTIVLAVVVWGSSGGGAATSDPCGGAVVGAAGQWGLTSPEINRTVFMDAINGGRDGNFFVGYEALINMNICRGTYAAKMSLQCIIDEVYARGACKMLALKNRNQ